MGVLDFHLFFLVSLFFIKKENSLQASPLVSKRVVIELEAFQLKSQKIVFGTGGILVFWSVGKSLNYVRNLVYYFFIFNVSRVVRKFGRIRN
ncbi:hypothetical protein LEP1GSC062_4569 [Leptospira alexanderi serovar Manhao 3 str. L 60]|uniref:Uncharacterized protein n=1 Tax=Leptospira alexanderi serovar Manhao 3 str. L 60 TaxID=1049759 RepID=V6I0H6_9LEPT|nr:hypothetical protein LEP1GSC062_4569 [Leptospira alexanderi serovar Manhao 3 str. L 60]